MVFHFPSKQIAQFPASPTQGRGCVRAIVAAPNRGVRGRAGLIIIVCHSMAYSSGSQMVLLEKLSKIHHTLIYEQYIQQNLFLFA